MNRKRLLTRRRTLLLGMGAFTVAGGLRHLNNQFPEIVYEGKDAIGKKNFTVVGDIPLRERAASKGLIYGAASSYRALASNADYATSFAKECAILVPEAQLKWDALRPSPNRFDFTRADWMAKFARTHGMLFRGHTLVWHKALPKWFAGTVNKRNAERILLEHIKTVVGHYAGKIHSWDVVNEAVFPEDGRSDGLRNSPWLQFLGAGYLDIAFRAAAEADPRALLVYNDFGLNYQYEEPKRVAVLKLLERLKSRGSPVQALGIQAHLWCDNSSKFNPKTLKKFLREIANMDLKILITELDVSDKNLPLDVSIRDRIVAAIYEDYLSAVLEEPAVIAVLTWGLSDRYTWLNETDSRKRLDRSLVRPLPLDTNLKRKLAWNAIARAFDQAPKRHSEQVKSE
jgi:endo-1,4-beta-xylanase